MPLSSSLVDYTELPNIVRIENTNNNIPKNFWTVDNNSGTQNIAIKMIKLEVIKLKSAWNEENLQMDTRKRILSNFAHVWYVINNALV